MNKKMTPDISQQLDISDFKLVSAQAAEVKRRSVNRLAVHFASKKNAISNGQPVYTAAKARDIVKKWVENTIPGFSLSIGLPEVDDRYEAWRVALVGEDGQVVGELMIRCSDGDVIQATKLEVITSRLVPKDSLSSAYITQKEPSYTYIGNSVVVCGDASWLCGYQPVSGGKLHTLPVRRQLRRSMN